MRILESLSAIRPPPIASRLTLCALRLTPYVLRLAPCENNRQPETVFRFYAFRLTPYDYRLASCALRKETPNALRCINREP